jgi:hypothetical protein
MQLLPDRTVKTQQPVEKVVVAPIGSLKQD